MGPSIQDERLFEKLAQVLRRTVDARVKRALTAIAAELPELRVVTSVWDIGVTPRTRYAEDRDAPYIVLSAEGEHVAMLFGEFGKKVRSEPRVVPPEEAGRVAREMFESLER